MAIITLLTDFGTYDEFCGVMKGVIYTLAPEAVIVDITHEIPPWDIQRAARMLPSYIPYFPEGSIHVVVVDPGVGTGRRGLALEIDSRMVVAPDNGVLTGLMDHPSVTQIVHLKNPDYFLKSTGNTFHGRDTFAPVAAHIANGRKIREMGTSLPLSELTRVKFEKPSLVSPDEIVGSIIDVDRFGNLITSVQPEDVEQICPLVHSNKIKVQVGETIILGIHATFGDVSEGEALAYWGSRGVLELAINCGNARNRFNQKRGGIVKISRKPVFK